MRRDCGLLKDAWYAAALSEELGPKRPIGRIVLGEMLVLWRDGRGVASAVLDRCPHRHALLSEGSVVDGCIRCPYHGWTFDKAGACVRVPSEGPGNPTLRKHDTESFQVRERHGLLWVWMGGEVAPDREPFSMPFYGEPGWRTYTMKTPFENDVTNLVENFMDVPHTVFVHRGWFRSARAIEVPTRVERREEEVLVTYHQENDSIGWTSQILNPKKLPMTHTDHFFMPNITRVDYLFGGGERGFVITSTCSPVSPTRTMVYTLISYKLGLFNHAARLFMPWYTRQVIGQDVEIMAIQRRALDHYEAPSFSSTPADVLHLYIESLRRWAESGGEGPRPKPVSQELSFWI